MRFVKDDLTPPEHSRDRPGNIATPDTPDKLL
jgi:hypothetical protein